MNNEVCTKIPVSLRVVTTRERASRQAESRVLISAGNGERPPPPTFRKTSLGSATPSRCLPDTSYPTEHEWGHRPLLSPELLSSFLSPLSDHTDRPKPEQSSSASGSPPGRKDTTPAGLWGSSPPNAGGAAAGWWLSSCLLARKVSAAGGLAAGCQR